MAKPTRRPYSFKFNLALVERFVAGETAPDLAAEVGLSSPGFLKRWARVYGREGSDALRPKPKGRPEAPRPTEIPELERLRREDERLRAEAAYLGKLLRALREKGRR